MQVRFYMILHAHGYNSLSYLTLNEEVWSANVSKYKLIRICQPDQLIQVKSFIPVFLVIFPGLIHLVKLQNPPPQF